jgi:hypothetical protein
VEGIFFFVGFPQFLNFFFLCFSVCVRRELRERLFFSFFLVFFVCEITLTLLNQLIQWIKTWLNIS